MSIARKSHPRMEEAGVCARRRRKGQWRREPRSRVQLPAVFACSHGCPTTETARQQAFQPSTYRNIFSSTFVRRKTQTSRAHAPVQFYRTLRNTRCQHPRARTRRCLRGAIRLNQEPTCQLNAERTGAPSCNPQSTEPHCCCSSTPKSRRFPDASASRQMAWARVCCPKSIVRTAKKDRRASTLAY